MRQLLPKFRPVLLGMACLFAMYASLAGLGPANDLAHADTLQQARVSPCKANVTRSVSPGFVLRGETATVRLSTNFICPGETVTLHLVLVLDASGTMSGTRTAEMKREARRLIDRLDMKNNPQHRVGVVQYNSATRILCDLSNDSGRAHACVGKVGTSGGTAIDKGITAGMNVLKKGRMLAQGITPSEVLLVLSDGANTEGCPPVVRAAGKAKGQGILVISVCLGPDCDRDCMRQVASSSRYFFDAPDVTDLAATFDAIWDALNLYGWKQIHLKDLIPENIEVIEGSVSAGAVYDPIVRELVWSQIQAPASITMSYKIRPLASGYLDTNGPSTLTFRDLANRTGTEMLPLGKILVLGR